MDTEKNIRAFLAIEPPPEVIAAVERLQEKLKRQISGKISWTRPQGNHLTLKFFGNIDGRDVDNICRAVQARAVAVSPLRLCIEKIGAFPTVTRPRVLWLGATGDIEKLVFLQKQMDEDFAGIGFPQENRPFRAHLTLGRIKIPQSVGRIEEAINKYNDFTCGEFHTGELILFQSKLSPKGATYTKLATIPLGG